MAKMGRSVTPIMKSATVRFRMNRFEDVLSLACLEEKNQVGTVNVGRGQGRERERGEDKFGTVRGEKLRCETRMGRGSGVKREWVEVQV